MKKKIGAILIASLFVTLAGTPRSEQKANPGLSPSFFAEFKNPGPEYRPWVRWWWPGNDVEEAELKREIQLLAQNFFGGAEIQAMNCGLSAKAGPDELRRRFSVDTDSFYTNLAVVMKEAQAMGLGVDLTLGSGWPSGGPHIQPEQNLKTLLWAEERVRGPKKVSLKPPPPRKPAFYYIASLIESALNMEVAQYFGEEAKVVVVVAAKVKGGRHSPNPFSLTRTVSLEPESVQVLPPQLERGKLNWQVPPGEWELIFFYLAPDGERPTLSAQPDPGYVADHLDQEVILAHLHHLFGTRTGLASFFGKPLRAFFNDSFEFKCERHFTADFLAEFQARRGYGLTPFLPAVLWPGGDNFFISVSGLERKPWFSFSPEDHRLLYDYSLTISDLFRERFLATCQNFAHQNRLLSRVQVHGMNIDLLSAYGQADIPETEQLYAGGAEMFLKMASSAAHLYHRPVVTAEAMVWAGKDYMTTPLKIKAAADKLFTSGSNQIIYHGFPYQKNHDYGETGWAPFSSPFFTLGTFSSNLSEANVFWKYLPRINQYLARCQFALRQGQPEVDLLIYYPWLGFPPTFSSVKNHDELLFNGYFRGQEPKPTEHSLLELGGSGGGLEPREAWLIKVWPLVGELEDAGFTWEWVNDESLALAEVKNGQLLVRGNRYQAVILAQAPSLQPQAASRLTELAQNGAVVLVIGEAPSRQPGFKDFPKGDQAVQEAMQKILLSRRGRKVERPSEAVVALLSLGAKRGLRYEGSLPIRHLRRGFPDGSQIIFLRNPEERTREFEFSVSGECEFPLWLDPWSGEVFKAVSKSEKLMARLEPFASMILACFPSGKKVGAEKGGIMEEDLAGTISLAEWNALPPWPVSRKVVGEIPLPSWELMVRGDDVPHGKFEQALSGLRDLRTIKELRFSGGPFIYRSRFNLSSPPAGALLRLDLGWIYGAAEVKVNGKEAGILLVPSYSVEVTNLVAPGQNEIEVTVIPAQQNRLVGKARQRKKGYDQFKNKEDSLLPLGMIGPTRIVLEQD